MPIRSFAFRWLFAGFVAVNLAACATYKPLPLAKRSDLAAALPANVAKPLGMATVAGLAVIDSPDLKVARDKAKVSSAEAFEAGLLPNPQLSANLDDLTNPSPNGFTNGHAVGLTYDLQALITHPSTVAAAKARRDQVRLDLLWQEWQVVARVRTLFVQAAIASLKKNLFGTLAAEQQSREKAVNQALKRGDLSLGEADTNLATYLDAASQAGAAARAYGRAAQHLRALLALDSQVALPLGPLKQPEILPKRTLVAALKTVASRRADLLALRAGYKVGEENVFKAVLSQFPAIQIGFARASDTSDVHTSNFSVTLDLPIFDHGQGRVAVARATRAELHAEYQARLDQTSSDAWRLWSEIHQLDRQLAALEADLPELGRSAAKANQSFATGDLSPALYYQIQKAYFTHQAEALDLRQSLWDDAIALDTVLGLPLKHRPHVKGNGA